MRVRYGGCQTFVHQEREIMIIDDRSEILRTTVRDIAETDDRLHRGIIQFLEHPDRLNDL